VIRPPVATVGYKRANVPYVPTLEPDTTPKAVVDIYRDFQRRMGFPAAPNFIKTQGHSLAAASGTWGLVQNVLGGAPPYLVALTGYGQATDRARGSAAGFDGHLVKPVDLAHLLRVIADVRGPGAESDAASGMGLE
jgi:hypothetical protein